jgi:hypothetical protein
MRSIGSSGSLARQGVIGPGKAAWLAFCGWADSRQMNHIVLMLVHNPGVFTGGTQAEPPEPTPKPKRGRKTEPDEDDLTQTMAEV